MHGEIPIRTGHRMVYSSILVALVSRRRLRSGRVKGMPIVAVLGRVGLQPVLYGDRMRGIHRVIGRAVFTSDVNGE
jgi:hypothetical protein